MSLKERMEEPDILKAVRTLHGVSGQAFYSLLLSHGRLLLPGNVKPGSRMKQKACYNNSITRMIQDDSVYVEGVVLIHGVAITHAWNLERGHVDHTIPDADQYQYLGLLIPDDIVIEVAGDKRFGLHDGVMGTLTTLPNREELLARIVAANRPR